MSVNRGFERVSKAPRNQGKFTSPNDEPLGKPIGVRLPASLENWISEEAKKQGTNKGNFIRTVLAEIMSDRTQKSL
ncbi:MAG: hypothetical protein AB4372_18810 [Xenococcus sp. (in: cyanobacteria)]